MAAAGVQVAAGTQVQGRHRVAPVVLGQQQAGDVQLAAADVGVQVDGAGHHHLAGEIDLGVDDGVGAGIGDDAAVRHKEIPHHAVDAVGRVVEATALKPQHGPTPS